MVIPMPTPVSTSAWISRDGRLLSLGPGSPAVQVAPVPQLKLPPPFSSLVHELATLHTPCGKNEKYFSIHAVISSWVARSASGTTSGQPTSSAMATIALGFAVTDVKVPGGTAMVST